MKQIKENINLIIGILTLLFVGFVIYNSFFREDKKSNIEEIIVGEENKDTKKILEILDKIDDIRIDSAFFKEDPKLEGYSLVFNQLEDFSQPIPDKRPGKVNPFMKGGPINYLDNIESDSGNINSMGNSDNVVVQEEIIEN